MQHHENTDPIAPKRGKRARKALIANTVCKSAMISGFFLCATGAESASLSGCYERRYAAAHLVAHPDQQVRRVALAVKPMSGHAPWVANADLEMAIRRQKGLVSVVGDCTEDGDALLCSMDSDRGSFRLVASAPGEVLLTINSTLLLQRAPFNDAGPFVELKPNDRENNAFLLKSVKAFACK
jgi:hypothetical protein